MEVLTVAGWLTRTNGSHLKDDVREIARLGDGGEFVDLSLALPPL